MAIVQVTFSNEPMLAALKWRRAVMLSTAVVTAIVTAGLAAVAILALYLAVRSTPNTARATNNAS